MSDWFLLLSETTESSVLNDRNSGRSSSNEPATRALVREVNINVLINEFHVYEDQIENVWSGDNQSETEISSWEVPRITAFEPEVISTRTLSSGTDLTTGHTSSWRYPPDIWSDQLRFHPYEQF